MSEVSLPLARLGVVGVGLMGGSIAAACRARWPRCEIRGCGPNPAELSLAQERGLIDQFMALEALADWAEVLILAVPMRAMESVLEQLSSRVRSTQWVMDLGSVKAPVCDWVGRAGGELAARFVPAHPIAGSHEQGPGAARVDLYRGREVILCPTPWVQANALSAAETFWHELGARTARWTANEHDRAYAALSHMPHLLSWALLQSVLNAPNGAEWTTHAGPGFLDMTRLAASPAQVWADILLTNRSPVLEAVESLRASLDQLEALLRQAELHDPAALVRHLHELGQARRSLTTGLAKP